MALFKIFKGLKANLPSVDTSQNGYCYFTTDDGLFYIDYADANGNLQRKALNAVDAQTLTGAVLSDSVDTIANDPKVIPNAAFLYRALELLNYFETDYLDKNKMDKMDPTGSGAISINRKEGTNFGSYSVSLGLNNEASEECSVAIGNNSVSNAPSAVAIGNNVIAESESQFVCGKFNIIDDNGDFIFIVGNGENDLNRSNCFTIDIDGNVNSQGGASFKNYLSYGINQTVKNIAPGAFQGGTNTKGIGNNSHAEGENTQAVGNNSHAEGKGTIASGNNSHAEGENTQAVGNNSHTSGIGTIADYDNSTVIGKYNAGASNALFIIGKGASNESRSNAMEVDSQGNVSIYGPTPTSDNHVITKGYIANNIPQMIHVKQFGDAGKSQFVFNNIQGIVDLSDPYYLVYFNGLLLIPGEHYVVKDKTTIELVGWTANDTSDILHIVGFRPLSPDNSIQGGA